MHILFTASLRFGGLPTQWKSEKIIPMHKSGDHNNPANYRPASLTSTSYKLIEHLILKHTIGYFQINNILITCQYGFRKSQWTFTKLTEVVHSLASLINNSQQTDVIFLDFSGFWSSVTSQTTAQASLQFSKTNKY